MQVKAYDKRFMQYCSLESRLLAEISSKTAQRKCSISKDCTSTNSEVPVVLYQAIAGVNFSRWSALFKHANFAGEFSRTITACSQVNKCNPGLILKVSCKLLSHSICIFLFSYFIDFHFILFVGLFGRNRCPRGKNCNFLHVYRNPGDEFDYREDLSPTRTPFNGGRASERSERSWWRDHWRRRRDLNRDRSRDRDWEQDRHRKRYDRDQSRERDDERGRHRRRSRERERSKQTDKEENRELRTKRRNYSDDDESEGETENNERFVLLLSLYTPTSVRLFFILFPLRFLWYWQGEFVLESFTR